MDPLVWLLSPTLLPLCPCCLSKHNKLIGSSGGTLVESNSSLSPGPYEKGIYIALSYAPLLCLHTYMQGENSCNRLFLGGHCLGGPPVSILPHVKLGPSPCHPPRSLVRDCWIYVSSLYPPPPPSQGSSCLCVPSSGVTGTRCHTRRLYACQGSELRLSYVCTQQAPSSQLDPHQPRPPFPHGVASFPLQICSDPGLTPSYLRDDEQIRVNSIFPLFQENNMSTTKAPINQ